MEDKAKGYIKIFYPLLGICTIVLVFSIIGWFFLYSSETSGFDLNKELQSMEESEFQVATSNAETNVTSMNNSSEEMKLYSGTTLSSTQGGCGSLLKCGGANTPSITETYEECNYGDISPELGLNMIGDGFCDDFLNNAACSFDMGDCCNEDQDDVSFCTECTCHMTSTTSPTGVTQNPDIEGCVGLEHASGDIHGDGYCDDFLNHEACDFDGGDCCLEPIQTAFCTTCFCLETVQLNPDTCGDQLWIGDMICDDENNNLHCHFDGGDCCLGETTLTDYCVECVCKDANGTAYTNNELTFFITECIEAWKGDLHCDEKNNKEICGYDGGDCCMTNKITTFCADCQCRDPSHVSYSGSTLQTSTTLSENIFGKCNFGTSSIDWIGDGFCDESLKSEACGMDGGDCCDPATLANCIGIDHHGDLDQDCQCGIPLTNTLSRSSNVGLFRQSIRLTPEKDIKIVGGNNAKVNSFPWQVAILQSWSSDPFCGGVIIGPKTILTAAHCIDDNEGGMYDVQVVVGVTNLKNTAAKWNGTYYVESIVLHPNWQPLNMNNDYAIIKLKSAITFSENVNAVCLPKDNQETYENIDLMISGWGETKINGFPQWLQFTRVTGVSNQQCCNTMFSYSNCDITENMICAGVVEGGVDSCQGDSGGPLIHKNKTTGISEVVGVVSWGFDCAQPNNYGIYARVTSVIPWILKNSDFYTNKCYHES